MSGPDNFVEVVDLDFAYRHNDGWLRVLHKVNFTIAKGEAFGLVGESGCGKSTMAYQLLGYRRLNSRVEGGRVLFKGTDLLALDRPGLDRLRGNRVSLVPQNPTTALSPGMRVGQQVAEVLQLHGVARGAEAASARVAELFGLVGLPEPGSIGQRYPHQLSGGQQQRVAIAMALACEPDLVVLDEPTTGLDVTTQEHNITLRAALRGLIGLSLLYVTHDLGVLAQIADRVGVMYAGHMIEIAPVDDLFAQPRHPYTRGLIASVPQIEGDARTAGQPLRGLLRRDDLPAGCPFQPRCDFAQPSCAANQQRLDVVAPGHEVACRRWRDIAAPHAASVAAESAAPGAVASAPPVLELDGVTLGYHGQRGRLARWLAGKGPAVVHELSFAIEAGQTFALVGESGSGKSTVARAVSGLIRPIAGRILFQGGELPGSIGARSGNVRRQIQYIFQNPDASLNPRARIGPILARPLEMFFDLDGRKIRERVARTLQDVRLDADYAARYPDQLSGGERQRVAIARALVCEPVLLLCDEILSALDVSVQANVLQLLQRLREEHRLAMLFIAHDLAVVRNLADRVAVLFRGQLMEIGATEDIFRPPFHPYTHSLLMAVPSVRADRRSYLARPAPPAAPPVGHGCAFAGRCPWQAGRLCEEVAPPWRTTEAGLRLRCHLPLDELAARAVWRPEGAEPTAAATRSDAAPHGSVADAS